MNEIIDELKKVREQFQITMFEISQGCQVKERSVQRWLTNGNNSKPHPSHFIKIKKFIAATRTKFEAEERAEIEKYRDIVLAEISTGNHTFIPYHKTSGRFALSTCTTGLLWHSLSLRRLKEITNASEEILIKILEQLAQEGLIRLFHIAVDSSLSSEDVYFKFELGTANRDIYENTVEAVRLYRKKPLSKEEKQSKAVILNIQERVNNLKTNKRAYFDKRHGTNKVAEIEKAMLKEDREADLEQKNAALRTAEGIEKLAKDKEEN